MVRTLFVPKLRFLPVGLAAVVLAACEVQPVVTTTAPPATADTTTAVAAPETVPETVPENGPENVPETAAQTTTETEPETDPPAEEMTAEDTADVAASDAVEPAGTVQAAEDVADAAETEGGDSNPAASEQPPATEEVAVTDTGGEAQPETSAPGDVTTEDTPTRNETADGETANAETTGAQTETTELAMIAPPPPPPPPPPPAELEPASLVGMTPAQLRVRLGEADFARQEGDMKTWQYRFSGCVVDYFLFPKDGVSRVAGWTWRAPVIGMDVDATSCRRALAVRDSAGG